jgi:hypothetical protein
MLQALSPEQVQDVISLVNDLRAKNQAREKSGEEPSIEDILYSPERQKLAAYLLNLSMAARTELIALMLLGRGDEFKSYSTALAHSLKYKKDAGGQVLYIFGKTMRLAKYLTEVWRPCGKDSFATIKLRLGGGLGAASAPPDKAGILPPA